MKTTSNRHHLNWQAQSRRISEWIVANRFSYQQVIHILLPLQAKVTKGLCLTCKGSKYMDLPLLILSKSVYPAGQVHLWLGPEKASHTLRDLLDLLPKATAFNLPSLDQIILLQMQIMLCFQSKWSKQRVFPISGHLKRNSRWLTIVSFIRSLQCQLTILWITHKLSFNCPQAPCSRKVGLATATMYRFARGVVTCANSFAFLQVCHLHEFWHPPSATWDLNTSKAFVIR